MPRERAESLAFSFEGFGVGLAGDADLGEIGFQAHAVPACSFKVLGGADEGAGAVVDGLAEGAEVAAGLRGEEDQGLLGLRGNVDEDALLTRGAGPGFDAGEPVEGRGVGGAAQEGYNENEMSGLAFRQVGMDPKAIAGQEIGHLADGKGDIASFDVNIHLGTGQIKGGTVGEQGDRKAKEP